MDVFANVWRGRRRRRRGRHTVRVRAVLTPKLRIDPNRVVWIVSGTPVVQVALGHRRSRHRSRHIRFDEPSSIRARRLLCVDKVGIVGGGACVHEIFAIAVDRQSSTHSSNVR